MAIHLIPLLLAKVAGKFAFKKAAHHGAHQTLGKKIAKEGARGKARMWYVIKHIRRWRESSPYSARTLKTNKE